MELSLSGNSLKTFTRSITCLARVGNELSIQASPSQLAFHTLNTSRSAYQSITFKPDFFDVYTISEPQVQCSVLLKAVCSVLRTPIASIDRLCVLLPKSDASKVQWTIYCNNGMKKSYWITCNVEPDIQHLTLDRARFPSNFVVRPRDLNRLLSNFQSSLQEITVIATEPTLLPSDEESEIGGKAVELRSYIDPSKDDSDTALHTQLWIDPTEEFLQYAHTGDPVDVTFAVKELKAFLTFCEGCEVDIHIFFEKAGEPILMAPKFGLDDGSTSDYDVTLVLASMLVSQLHQPNPPECPPAAAPGTSGQADQGAGYIAQQEGSRASVSEQPSDHTRIWSELSGSAARSGSGVEERQVEARVNPDTNGQSLMERVTAMGISNRASAREDALAGRDINHPPMETANVQDPQGRDEMNGHGWSQHHPSNWVGPDEDDDEDENDMCVQSTPPY
ncbi:hypothetical protein MKW94_020775 [Papaver nudicaule]|uniref:Cell cycle checkpoint control protein RAD9A n=1 Tax=Papaver nudicaule TaxID=74823 RepID=A0AA41VLY7_PAPNU|nr:hypothetical protein [Papaver nudicaule]